MTKMSISTNHSHTARGWISTQSDVIYMRCMTRAATLTVGSVAASEAAAAAQIGRQSRGRGGAAGVARPDQGPADQDTALGAGGCRPDAAVGPGGHREGRARPEPSRRRGHARGGRGFRSPEAEVRRGGCSFRSPEAEVRRPRRAPPASVASLSAARQALGLLPEPATGGVCSLQ